MRAFHSGDIVIHNWTTTLLLQCNRCVALFIGDNMVMHNWTTLLLQPNRCVAPFIGNTCLDVYDNCICISVGAVLCAREGHGCCVAARHCGK